MNGAGFPVFWVLSILLLIFFTLLFSVPKHHELLFSIYDFIVVAKSSRVAVFFMFNVIIIIVFVGSPKLSDHQGAAGELITSLPALEYDLDAKYEENDDNYDGSDIEVLDEYHGYDGYDEENDDDLDTEDDQDSEEDEKDNDLERRIDEFIAKVTRKWREELLTERLLCTTAS
ncbi:hypothetical protein CRYUN_Cryun01aG0240500 [Craigia yunnanensis]